MAGIDDGGMNGHCATCFEKTKSGDDNDDLVIANEMKQSRLFVAMKRT
jgi:hypothetical protein